MDNNEFEQLIWKVIHNKYLFNLIFEKIHEISNEIEQTHDIVSYKFKDMRSVTWMIKHGAFNILKYKLSNNEEIEFSEEDIVQDIVSFLIKKNGDAYRDTGVIHGYAESVQIVSNRKKESILSILSLLLKNYTSNFSKYDLIILVLETTCKIKQRNLALEIIRTLVSEHPIYCSLKPHHFKLVILNYNVEFIKEFIEIANQFNCNIVDQDFKEQSLLIVLNKEIGPGKQWINQKVLQFILDHPQYHCETYDTKFVPTERSGSLNIRAEAEGYLDYRVKHDFGKRDIINFDKIDKELQIKLVSLKFFNTYSWYTFEKNISKLIRDNNNKELLQERKRRDNANQFIYDINNNTDMDELSKIKLIYKYFFSN